MRAVRILVSVLAVLALWSSPLSASAEPEGSPALTAAEFLALLQANDGGTVKLEANVIWDSDAVVMLSAPTRVETGDYGITVAAGRNFLVSGAITFIGNGVTQPVLTILGAFDSRLIIEAVGNNATAVRTVGDVRLTEMRVRAPRSGSVAVQAEGSLTITRSEVLGNQASVIPLTPQTQVMVDSSNVIPSVPSAQVIEREAVPAPRFQENGVTVPIGTDPQNINSFNMLNYYLLDTQRKVAAESYPHPVECTVPPIDTSVPGEYVALCEPTDLIEWFPVKLPSFEVPLHVIDPSKPFLGSAGLGLSRWGVIFSADYFNPIEGADEIILRYSIDDGESWEIFNDLPEANVDSYAAYVQPWNLPRNNCVYLFQLEVIGGEMAGLSNILRFSYYDSDPDYPGIGGDRTGADRFPIGEGEPPTNPPTVPPTINPPTTPPPTTPPPTPITPPPTSSPSPKPPIQLLPGKPSAPDTARNPVGELSNAVTNAQLDSASGDQETEQPDPDSEAWTPEPTNPDSGATDYLTPPANIPQVEPLLPDSGSSPFLPVMIVVGFGAVAAVSGAWWSKRRQH